MLEKDHTTARKKKNVRDQKELGKKKMGLLSRAAKIKIKEKKTGKKITLQHMADAGLEFSGALPHLSLFLDLLPLQWRHGLVGWLLSVANEYPPKQYAVLSTTGPAAH
jgi:hypothetical protein